MNAQDKTLSMKTIMIVDDEASIRGAYSKMLVNCGYHLLVAESTEEATELLIRHQIDLILLDIQMPDLDGVLMDEVIKIYNPNIKVIVSSVYPIHEQRRKIQKAHAYFDKAEGLETLVSKVKKALE